MALLVLFAVWPAPVQAQTADRTRLLAEVTAAIEANAKLGQVITGREPL